VRDQQRDPLGPGDRSRDPEAHDALNNPVEDPDETEYPDPYDKRPDPRAEGRPAKGSTSTSEPHPAQDPQAEPGKGRSGTSSTTSG
jgi:hypothetical protein